MTLSPLLVTGIVGVMVGVIIFIVGSLLVRSSDDAVASATPRTPPEIVPASPAVPALLDAPSLPVLAWTREITGDDEAVEADVRIDMLERLAMVGEPWCAALLARAAEEERDETVLDAAERALLVVRARPISV